MTGDPRRFRRRAASWARWFTRRGPALGLTLLGAGLLALAALPVWVRGSIDDPVLGLRAASVTGRVAAPLVLALGLLALAAALVAAVTGRVGRALAGLLAVGAGLGSGWVALGVLRDGPAALARSAAGAVGRSGVTPVSGVTVTPWPWLALVGGALAALGGVAVVCGAPRWAGSNARYENPADRTDAQPEKTSSTVAPEPQQPGQRAGTTSAAQRAEADARAARSRAVQDWDALSRGEDPTD